MTENDKDSALPIETPGEDKTKETLKEVEALTKSAASDASLEPESTSEETELPKKRSFPIVYVFLLLVIASMGAGGYWLWQNSQNQVAALISQQQIFSEELEATRTRMSSFESLNNDTNSEWQRAVRSLETLVVESAQRLNAQANRTENRWPLEEALTLARLANQRLQLDASAEIATGLLSSADLILADLDPAAVLPIRRQIAADILALETTPAADVNGLYFQLDAMSGEIKALSWVPKPTMQQTIPEDTELAEGFWASLKQIVVVDRLDVPMEAPPLQSDFERWRQHTLLLIEQTQLAVLARNQRLYDDALLQLLAQLELMQSQFDFAPLQVKLADAQSAVLNPQWPDVNASVLALEGYLSEQAAGAAEQEEASQ